MLNNKHCNYAAIAKIVDLTNELRDAEAIQIQPNDFVQVGRVGHHRKKYQNFSSQRGKEKRGTLQASVCERRSSHEN
jgi:hypothetical protein